MPKIIVEVVRGHVVRVYSDNPDVEVKVLDYDAWDRISEDHREESKQYSDAFAEKTKMNTVWSL